MLSIVNTELQYQGYENILYAGVPIIRDGPPAPDPQEMEKK